MQPRSNTLFHFTPDVATLKKILTGGYWPRFCLEDITWQESGIEKVAFPMVCFCDIPLARISEHVDFYGSYGIGMKRSWALKHGLNPIFYLSPDSSLSLYTRQAMRDILSSDNKKIEEDDRTPIDNMRLILSHIKPLVGVMTVGGEDITKDFYQESEWRYIPNNENCEDFLTPSEFSNERKLNAANRLTKKHSSLSFNPEDISYIFVRDDKDIPKMVDFIQTKMDHFKSIDLKILVSKIFSLESMRIDL